jgi:hypothetical protein
MQELEGGEWQLGAMLDHSGHGSVRGREQQHERDADGEGEVFHLSTADEAAALQGSVSYSRGCINEAGTSAGTGLRERASWSAGTRPWRNTDSSSTDSGAARHALIARHAEQRQLSLFLCTAGNKSYVLHTPRSPS